MAAPAGNDRAANSRATTGTFLSVALINAMPKLKFPRQPV
jgi:hypothetical protein